MHLCFSIDGLAGSEATYFLKRMACRLSIQWNKSFAEVLGWIRARLAFAILRESVLCICGFHIKWRILGLEDGEGPTAHWPLASGFAGCLYIVLTGLA